MLKPAITFPSPPLPPPPQYLFIKTIFYFFLLNEVLGGPYLPHRLRAGFVPYPPLPVDTPEQAQFWHSDLYVAFFQ